MTAESPKARDHRLQWSYSIALVSTFVVRVSTA
jgi:hypothetical protein